MTDNMVYTICTTMLMVFALYRVTAIAILAVSRAIPDRGYKDQ